MTSGFRVWRDEGLRVPQTKREKPQRGIGAMSPIRPNAPWAMDFQFDVAADGRTLKLFERHPRVRLRSARHRRRPQHRRRRCPCRDGPHLICSGWATRVLDPGSPWQNAWIESFNSRLRDELLNDRQFDNLLEARVIIEDWRIDYIINRPHTAHGDLTPTEFADHHGLTMNQPQAA